MAAAAMFSHLSDRFAKFVCGASSPTTMSPDDDDDDRRSHSRANDELRSFLLLSPSPSPADDSVTAAASLADEEESAAATLPCLAFASEHGYMLFSLAHMRMLAAAADEVRPMPAVLGRRLVPSPYGGTVLATDVCYRHPCHLADPFTGARTPLPDLPIPFSEKEPMELCLGDDEPPPRHRSARATTDGLAWDWSPRGVMVARGDTAFFCAYANDGGERRRWAPVHRSRHGSPMTVNYRGGRFFLLELRTLVTTVIDAATLHASATISAPPSHLDDIIDSAYLAPSCDDDVFLLVHRAGDRRRGGVFTEAYRAQLGGGRSLPRWRPVHDIGDRAVFVDGAHGFTVAAGLSGAKANHVYVILALRFTHPCGRLAVTYDVGFSDLMRLELTGRMKLDVGEVDRMWGQPHWIIPRARSDRSWCQGSID